VADIPKLGAHDDDPASKGAGYHYNKPQRFRSMGAWRDRLARANTLEVACSARGEGGSGRVGDR
jgi:hypothetical protein